MKRYLVALGLVLSGFALHVGWVTVHHLTWINLSLNGAQGVTYVIPAWRK